MFPPIPPLINVDMIYQYQPNPYVGLFNPAPAIIQQIPQQNPFLSQLIHTQQQIINNQILQNASMFVQQHQQQQHHHQQQQHEHLQITSSQCSSLPTSSTTEINDNDLASFQQETSFGDKIKFATWNVRGAVEMDKRNAIDRCLHEKMVQIACIQETKLQITQLETANYRWHLIHRKNDHSIHCGTAILVKHNFNGAVTNFEAITGNIFSCFVRSKESTILVISAHLTDEVGTEVEFERLKNFLKLYESLPVIIFGDFNAQLGKLDLTNSDQVFMGRFLYHDKCNNNGRLLKDLASEAKLFIKNTFRSNKIYKWKLILTTCRLKDKTSTSKAIEAQTDHILTSREGIVFVKMLRGYYRNNIKTDHKMIVADIEIRSKESGANENVIDLSLDDDVPGNSQVMEKEHSSEQDPTHDNQYTRKELLFRERLGRCGNRLTNEQSNTNSCTVNDIEADNSKVNKPNKMQISPGEPVPPGFEDVVKPVAELQVILSKYRTSPMLGLEYVIELIMGDRRPRTYHCALCDLICDTKDIIDHIKSYEHRCKYLEKHFSTVMVALSQYRHHKSAKNVLAGVVEAVCDSIEDAYGRMVPSVFENNDYTTNRAIYMKRLAGERHFDEKSGSTFIGVVDHRAIQSAFEKLAEATKSNSMNTVAVKRPRIEPSTRGKRGSFDSISSSDSVTGSFKRKISSTKAVKTIATAEQINLDLISSDSDDDSSSRRRKNSSSRRSSSFLRDDETEDYKYERYRSLTEKAVRNATNLLQEYEKSPEKHPMYPSEWKRYWNRRSKELEAAGRDPSNFDFSPEWSKYWLRRLRELYEDEIALKKFEIRKKLNLSADYYPRSTSTSYGHNDQPSSSSSSSYRYEKDESRMLTQYSSETVSEDNADDEPLTVISVLRLLAALEDLLGSTLGKKVLDLLSKAVHLEKLKANLADDVLMNEENSVLLDTVKEKLKGLIIAKIVNNQQINAVRRAIRNVESIVAIIDEKISVGKVKDEMPPNPSDKKESNNDRSSRTEAPKPSPTESERRNESLIEISKQIATAFLIQKMNITKERLEELTANYSSQSRDSSETPYLYGVRMSQSENNFSARTESSHFPSQSQSSPSSSSSSQLLSASHAPQQQQQQLQKKPQSLMEGGSGFAFNLFNNRNSTVNSVNSRNFSNRSNNVDDTYQSHNSSSSSSSMNQNQYGKNFRSSESSNQQNFNRSQQNHSQQHQRFPQQKASATSSYRQQQNSSNKGMNMNSNNNNNFHPANRRNPNHHMSIWESDTMIGNQSQGFDQKSNSNSIWDTNPMQNQSQQQFNHHGSYQQNTKQQQPQQQSHYNNFYQQQNQPKNQQPIWDNQFPQHQNNRNSRRH